MLTQERLKHRLHYEPSTGVFTWLNLSQSKQHLAGEPAGWTGDDNGYVSLRVDGKNYYAHRLAFLYMNGEFPKYCDHINRVKNDNRWCNLRPATMSQNRANASMRSNNTSGLKGVSWESRSKMWRAQICFNGITKHIGYFDCKKTAYAAYVLASHKYHGEFSTVQEDKL